MSNEMKGGSGGRPGTNMTVDEVTTMVLTALGSNSRHNDPNKSDLNELTSNLNYIALAATSSPPRRLPVLDALISADAFHAINTLKGALAERRAAYEDMGRISRSINPHLSQESGASGL